MVKGLQTIEGKWYYMDTEGRMATRGPQNLDFTDLTLGSIPVICFL